jgi:outer membrane protein assembly factor BamD (BamD/ComL family)
MPILALGLLAACATSGGKKGEPPAPPEEVYQKAMRKIEKKKYYSARTMLQNLLPRIPPEDRDLLPKVQLAIADAYFKDRGLLNYGEALNGYRNFLTSSPTFQITNGPTTPDSWWVCLSSSRCSPPIGIRP